MLDADALYLEHLSAADLELIGEVFGSRTRLPADLRGRPGLLDRYLSDQRLFDAVFATGAPRPTATITPFLTFGILVNRAAADLSHAAYVSEWSAPGKRLPIFDVASLRDFTSGGLRRYFLIEVLASFTRVASGSRWVRTRSGYRRRRFSELDLVRLAELVDDLPTGQRPAGYRRLGDVSLFLAGVFPDHSARHVPAASERSRLSRSAGVEQLTGLGGEGLAFYETAGAAWYRRAVAATQDLVGSAPSFLGDVAERFGQARRFLNHLADQYLYRVDGLAGPSR